MKRSIIILLMMCVIGEVSAQLTFRFIPEVYARNVDGLSSVQVQNLSGAVIEGRVTITVTETISKLPVVNITTPAINFNPGNNSLPRTAFSSSRFNFANNRLASIVNQTRNFPPGEYNICFRFMAEDKPSNNDFENCFDASVQPLLPISLINPADLDTICLKRPVLSWQPPMPYNASMRFRLIMTEKKYGDGTEDILKNVPLLVLDNISTSTINYPSNYPELKEGKTYYWQVAAYQQGVIISTSEVWEFTAQCKETEKPLPSDSYRELKQVASDNYYIAIGVLKFMFLNNYNTEYLRYSILDINNGMKKVKRLPRIKLEHGLNKVDVDLRDMDLEPGKQYLLKVFPFNEQPVEIRFTYKED